MGIRLGTIRPLGRLLRIVIVTLAFALAFAAFRQSAGEVLASKGLPVAYRFDPHQRAARALRASLLLQEPTSGPTADAVRQARQLSRETLAKEPLHAASLRVFAFTTSLQERPEDAKLQLLLSERLSRRELGTQIALIEYCVADGDVRCALEHYANALRTRKEAEAILHPKLIAGLEDAEIRTGLATYIRRGEKWTGRLLNVAAQESDNPAAVAQLVVEAGPLPSTLDFASAEQILLPRLFYADKPEQLRALYLRTRGAAVTALTRADFAVETTAETRMPVHWQPLASESGSGQFEPTDRGIALRGTSFARTPVPVARKLLFLPEGQYVLRQAVASDSTFGDKSEWRMRCVPAVGGPSTPSVSLRRPIEVIAIPNCRSVVVELFLAAPRDGDANVLVEAFSIKPLKDGARKGSKS